MQTFLPYDGYTRSAKVLDRQRLGKQRVEVLQILGALIDGKGWIHHPATKMWSGYELQLGLYGMLICKEWRSRGYNDTCLNKIYNKLGRPNLVEMAHSPKPHWFGDPEFHLAHQSNLVRKFPEHYRPLFPGVPDNLDYVWPGSSR